MREHRKKIKNMKPVVSIGSPEDRKKSPRAGSPSKTSEWRNGTQAHIAKNNLILARRIFDIMEGPGIISNLLEQNPCENHPGTINFPHRLAAAKRIHEENMVIAARLDSVKAYYDKTNLRAVSSAKNKGHISYRSKLGKSRRLKTEKAKRLEKPGNSAGRVVLGKNALQVGNQVDEARSEEKPKRPRNVLLEYTKIQRGRVLDVAVIKEPFRDSYSIFGIDIDNGQRYELRLTSDEVSSILEGDILVTSVDNVEVWMALLNKVELKPVAAFAKAPLPANVSKSTNNVEVRSTRSESYGSSNCAALATDDVDSLMTDEGALNREENSVGQEETYTLDEYYENNVPLSPLPQQNLAGASAPKEAPENEAQFGEILDATFFDRMSTEYGSSVGDRPAARSASRGSSRPLPSRPLDNGIDSSVATSTTQVRRTHSEEGRRETIRAVAIYTTDYIAECSLRNALMTIIMRSQQQAPMLEPQALDAKQKKAATSKSPRGPVPPGHQISPKPPNPYTSTKVTVAPRSNSIRYTQIGGAGPLDSFASANEVKDPRRTVVKPPIDPPNKSFKRTSVAKKVPEQGHKNPQRPSESMPSVSRRPTHRQPKESIGGRPYDVVGECKALAQAVANDLITEAEKKVSLIVQKH